MKQKTALSTFGGTKCLFNSTFPSLKKAKYHRVRLHYAVIGYLILVLCSIISSVLEYMYPAWAVLSQYLSDNI